MRGGAVLLATLFAAVLAVAATLSLSTPEASHADHAVAVPAATHDSAHDHGHPGSGQQAGASQPAEAAGLSFPALGDGTGGLCVGLVCLMAALIALAARLADARRVVSVLPRWLDPHLVAHGRFSDPPCLHRLSVMRC